MGRLGRVNGMCKIHRQGKHYKNDEQFYVARAKKDEMRFEPAYEDLMCYNKEFRYILVISYCR